jgi:predicted nuclease of predicted toxin-antitoxin system
VKPDGPTNSPPRFLADEDFGHTIVKALRRRLPGINILRIQDAGLRGAGDSAVLRYAKEHDRILLTHDSHTMPGHFDTLLLELGPGEHSPGVMWIAQESPIGIAVAAIEVVYLASSHEEWRNQFVHLPL